MVDNRNCADRQTLPGLIIYPDNRMVAAETFLSGCAVSYLLACTGEVC